MSERGEINPVMMSEEKSCETATFHDILPVFDEVRMWESERTESGDVLKIREIHNPHVPQVEVFKIDELTDPFHIEHLIVMVVLCVLVEAQPFNLKRAEVDTTRVFLERPRKVVIDLKKVGKGRDNTCHTERSEARGLGIGDWGLGIGDWGKKE